MKYIRTEYWVEYNFLEDGRPMNIKVFSDKKEAEKFAKQEHSVVVETRSYKC